MTYLNPYAELNNRDSAIVQDALARRCDICKAKPTEPCRNLAKPGKGLPGRLVHYMRTSE